MGGGGDGGGGVGGWLVLGALLTLAGEGDDCLWEHIIVSLSHITEYTGHKVLLTPR